MGRKVSVRMSVSAIGRAIGHERAREHDEKGRERILGGRNYWARKWVLNWALNWARDWARKRERNWARMSA